MEDAQAIMRMAARVTHGHIIHDLVPVVVVTIKPMVITTNSEIYPYRRPQYKGKTDKEK